MLDKTESLTRKVLDPFFPEKSRRRSYLKILSRLVRPDSHRRHGYYNVWMHQSTDVMPTGPPLKTKDGPLVSIVVPAYNTPPKIFDELIYSITSQSYPNWELVLMNASTEKETKARINNSAAIDKRIKVFEVPNKGISANTNAGIRKADGEYIAFVDHDDVLDSFALAEVVQKIKDTNADLVYTDEDKITEDSEAWFDPHYKPDWSPDLLTHVNYITHLVVIKKALLDRIGLLDSTKDGAQDYDLLLRITDTGARVEHISKVLYHWRASSKSTANDFDTKGNIRAAGVKALEEHFERQGTDVAVRAKPKRPGFYELHYKPLSKLTIIVTPFASNELIKLFVELLIQKTNPNGIELELILPDGVSLDSRVKIRTIKAGKIFLHRAIEESANENVIVINAVMLPQNPDWLDRISGLMRVKHIAAASPILIRNGEHIEDCGFVRLADYESWPLFRNEKYKDNQTFFGNTDWVRNVDALSGGFILTRASQLKEYLNGNEPNGINFKELLYRYTAQAPDGQFNTVFSDVVFDNHSIRIPPPSLHGRTFFNHNLFYSGHSFEIYTPENSVISILLKLQQEMEDNAK